MPRVNRTKAQTRKPYPELSLFLHATGQWAKKIRGKLHYFGTDPDAALQKYLADRDYLQVGLTPPRYAKGRLTLKEMGNEFPMVKENRLNSGEFSERSFRDYLDTGNSASSGRGSASTPSATRSASWQTGHGTSPRRITSWDTPTSRWRPSTVSGSATSGSRPSPTTSTEGCSTRTTLAMRSDARALGTNGLRERESGGESATNVPAN